MADIATDKVKNVTQSAEEIAGKVAEQARERGLVLSNGRTTRR
jgi:hypothetical protein